MKFVKNLWLTSTVILASLFAFSSVSFSGETLKYTGEKKCFMCHKTQHTVWIASKHAKAFETLGTDAAKKFSADPQKDAKCLKCHVTGYGAEGKIVEEHGVQCESCHGAGEKYAKDKIMKVQKDAIDAGMILPTEAKCKECHNANSPTFTAFNFAEAVKTIAHPNPEKK
jgi:hypothetical protein